MLISLVLAIKYSEDNYYINKVYATIGGVSVEELNYLESEMLKLLRYRLYVSPQLYYGYLEQLKEVMVEPMTEVQPAYGDGGTSMTTIDSSVNNS